MPYFPFYFFISGGVLYINSSHLYDLLRKECIFSELAKLGVFLPSDIETLKTFDKGPEGWF